jgi:hypothetical protein
VTFWGFGARKIFGLTERIEFFLVYWLAVARGVVLPIRFAAIGVVDRVVSVVVSVGGPRLGLASSVLACVVGIGRVDV